MIGFLIAWINKYFGSPKGELSPQMKQAFVELRESREKLENAIGRLRRKGYGSN